MEYVKEYLTYGILIFFVVNLINVMLSTVKSIWTVKSTRMMATVINALSYGFYALIVKQMANYQLEVVVGVTIIANLIGVYFSMWLLDRFKKDKLWKISVIIMGKDYLEIRDSLLANDIGFNDYEINTKYGYSVGLDIFSKSQDESRFIKKLFDEYSVKYHVMEIGKSL